MKIKNLPEYFPNVQLQLIEPGYHCSDTELRNSDNVYTFMQELLKHRNTECVYVITLGNDFKPINYSLVGKGNTANCAFNLPDIVKICLLSNASNCILVHNHLSSGIPSPSNIDDDTAQELYKTLRRMQITLCDTLITSPTGYYSYLKERRAPYDNTPTNYRIEMPIPDPPYMTLILKTNLNYAQNLYGLYTSSANKDLPFE